jgi:Fe2+ or Zn2+ uptake regulation protein
MRDAEEVVKSAVGHVLKAMEDYQLIERFKIRGEKAIFVLDRHHCDAQVTVNLLTGETTDNLEDED